MVAIGPELSPEAFFTHGITNVTNAFWSTFLSHVAMGAGARVLRNLTNYRKIMQKKNDTKERPIPFSSSMVQAILAGTKTQTRRLVKPSAWASEADMRRLAAQQPAIGLAFFKDGAPKRKLTCPYGVIGDRLWVKETWWPCAGGVVYRAGGLADCPDGGKWKPARFMPRWASRITLEVSGVRVERLQHITEEDAEAEGVPPDFGNAFSCASNDYRRSFSMAWEAINGRRAPWASNPWVWVISFRRVAVESHAIGQTDEHSTAQRSPS